MNPDSFGDHRFRATSASRRRTRRERLAMTVLAGMTCAMIVPLVLIVGYLFVQAAPMLSLDFLLDSPRRGMRAESGPPCSERSTS